MCLSSVRLFVFLLEDRTLRGFLCLCLDSLNCLFSLFPHFLIFTKCSTLLTSSHLFTRLFSFAYFMFLILPFCVFFSLTQCSSTTNILQTLHTCCLVSSPLFMLIKHQCYCLLSSISSLYFSILLWKSVLELRLWDVSSLETCQLLGVCFHQINNNIRHLCRHF